MRGQGQQLASVRTRWWILDFTLAIKKIPESLFTCGLNSPVQ